MVCDSKKDFDIQGVSRQKHSLETQFHCIGELFRGEAHGLDIAIR
jgi:hypothetical protein